MNRFRQFLSGTEGETACLFWLDVQLLHHLLHTLKINERSMCRFIDQIWACYVTDGAPLPINREIRSKLISAACYLHPTATVQPAYTFNSNITNNTYKRYIHVLSEAQKHVITSLIGYWCKVYVSTTKNGPQSLHPKMLEKSKDKATNVLQSQKHSHSLQDSGMYIRHSTTETCMNLPDINSDLSSSIITKVHSLSTTLQAKPLFTSSTTELFPQSNLPLQYPSHQTSIEYLNIYPYLNASLRADALAGHPFLTFLSRHRFHTTHVNYLLFWQSAEHIFTLDEIRRWHKQGKRRQQQTNCITPYLTYTDQLYPTAKNPIELVQLFIMEGSPYKIELPHQIRDELTLLLPRGLGQSLLLSIQEFAAQVYI